MSQSDSSIDSTVTLHQIQYVDIMSMAQEEEEEEDEEKTTMMENPDAVMVLSEEMDLMIQRLSQITDCVNEMLGVLLPILRSMKRA